jgi:hypothetical protein
MAERTYVNCRLCGWRTWTIPGPHGCGLINLHFAAEHSWMPYRLRRMFWRADTTNKQEHRDG